MGRFDFQMFANRVRKMEKHHGKWARRQGVTCYRIYDADVPEFPLVVDRYGDYLHVAEYQKNTPLDEHEYRLWRAGCRDALQGVFELPPDRIFYKERRPQKGSSQYEKRAEKKKEIEVLENGLRFIVNLSDYLDTGLFLDHRITRQMVRERAKSLRVLNLFAYTGTFSVYAAAGGAASTTTIDLSNTYLDWAQRNLELNGFTGERHRLLRADVTEWLLNPPNVKYDLIVLDPPTFSNSKNMRHILDVQRDHPRLINACLRLLSGEGVLFFSTNFRKFRLSEEAVKTERIEDISQATIPKDFRNKRIHYCFQLHP